MTTETSGMTVTAVIQEQNISFLSENAQLKSLAKEIGKATKPAIAMLVKLLDSKDEKIQMQAAIKLLEFDIDIQKTISQDQMQRLIAEIKLNRPGGNLKQIPVNADGTPARQPPMVDFNTIREF
jgi:hypothetical protein